MRKLSLIFVIMTLLLAACGAREEEGEGTAVPEITPVQSPTPQIGVSFATRAAPTVAIIQTTPTPLPTPTATPTPTPIVYQVASGDTILDIAIQRGTTVEQILALNPEVVPENLQIGQPIILPPPATVNVLLAPGTAVPLQLSVTNIQLYRTAVGSLWLLGEVTNEGETAVENVQVELGLLTADGQSAGRVVAWVATSVILPGERGPFGALLNEPPNEVVQPTVAIMGGQAVVELGTRTLDIAVRDVNLLTENDTVSLTGMVANRGETTVANVQLTATFYDAQGDVTGFQQLILAEQLGVGEERPFQLEASPPGAAIIAYSLHAEAQLLEN